MPKPYQPVKKNTTGGYVHDTGRADDAVSSDVATDSGSTAGKDLGTKGKSGEGMPKMKPGQSPAAYGEEMRQWREAQKTPQKKAIGEMLAGESKE